jgi:monoamine oxidase
MKIILSPLTVVLFLTSSSFAAEVTPPSSNTVLIVGAGLTGLTTAYELKKAGIPSVLIEASSRPGGRVQTVSFPDHVHIEAHMEEYWGRSPAYNLLQELKLPLREDVAHSSVRIAGRLYPYTGEGDRDTYLKGIFNDRERAAWIFWSQKNWQFYRRLHESFYAGKALPAELRPLMKLSFAAYITSSHLPRKVSEWIRITLEPEIAVEWDRISALDGIDEMRIYYDTEDGFGEKNYHVEGGNQRFVEALISKLDAGSVILDSVVTRIAHDASGVSVRYLTSGSDFHEAKGKAVVITVPLFNIRRLQIEPELSADKIKAISTLKLGSYVKVNFSVSPGAEAAWLRGQKSVLTLLSDSPAGSIYEATSGQKSADDGADKWLTLLIHGQTARELASLSANEIRQRSAKALNDVFRGIAAHIHSTEIFVYPTAVAYWPVADKRSRFDELSQALRKPDGNLYVGGDTTDDSHSEGAIQAALRMARLLRARKAELNNP